MIISPSDMGEVVRAARKAEQLTQQQLADLAGLSDRTLRDIERGTGGPSIGMVLHVCEVLGVNLRAGS